VSDQRSWLPLAAVFLLTLATSGLLYWAVHRASAAPIVAYYQETLSEEALRAYVQDEQVILHGRQLFHTNCTLCHGTSGQGIIGVNLRDEYWLHGSNLQQISESIANGNPKRGMAPWKPVFSQSDLHAVVAYIVSLQGTDDGSGKPPEGVLQPMDWRKKSH
jgi:cbb3-type cytochrome c oxidase subunit III